MGINAKRNSGKGYGGYSCRNKQIESWLNSPEISHQRWQSKSRGPKEDSYKNGRNSAGASHNQTQAEACKSNPRWRDSERDQCGIVAPPIRVDIMQEIPHE